MRMLELLKIRRESITTERDGLKEDEVIVKPPGGYTAVLGKKLASEFVGKLMRSEFRKVVFVGWNEIEGLVGYADRKQMPSGSRIEMEILVNRITLTTNLPTIFSANLRTLVGPYNPNITFRSIGGNHAGLSKVQ